MQYIIFCFSVLFTFQLTLLLSEVPSMWLLGLWGFLLLLLVLFRKKLQYPKDHPFYLYRKSKILGMFIALFFLVFSYLYFHSWIEKRDFSEIREILFEQDKVAIEETVRIKGVIDSPVIRDGAKIQFTLLVEQLNENKLNHEEKVLVQRFAQEEEEIELLTQLQQGDIWIGNVQLKEPDMPRHPGAFHYKSYLRQQGVHFIVTITDGDWASKESKNLLSHIFYLLDTYRQGWAEQVDQLFSEEIAPMVKAMTIGVRSDVDPDLTRLYQELGLIHLLAISGLHVGIIIWLLYTFLLKLSFTRERVLTFLFFLLPLYVILSGAAVSVIRSALMGMILLFCLRFGFWKSSPMALFVVYIGLLFWNPGYLEQIGFQLSFVVTFGLLLTYSSFKRLFQWLPEKIGGLLTVSFIAQIFSLPFILHHFYQFSPLSFFLNVFLVPLFSLFFIPAAFFLPLFSFFSKDLTRLGVDLYEKSLIWVHGFLEIVQSISLATLHVGKPALWWQCIFFLVIISVLLSLEKKKTLVSWIICGLFPLLILVQLILPFTSSEAVVTMLDVGQGDAIVLELPYRQEVILIDLGGQPKRPQEEWQMRKREFEVGQDVILPFLRYRGINHVDKIIITHGHYDHLGGIQGLVGNIPISEILRPPIPPQSSFEEEWLQKAMDQKINITSLKAGDEWSKDEVYFKVLYPSKPKHIVEEISNLHDYNLVLFNKIYETAFIWTGDMEQKAEEEVMKNYPDLKGDILKVAHHGSDTSTTEEWVQQIKPKVAYISVGRKNRFGHPHQDVLERLEKHHLKVFRTDQLGAITTRVSKQGFKVFSALQEYQE